MIVVVERRGRSEESESGEEEKQAPGDGGDQREDAVAEMAEVSPENGGSENDAVEVVAAAVSLLLLHLSNWRENGKWRSLGVVVI